MKLLQTLLFIIGCVSIGLSQTSHFQNLSTKGPIGIGTATPATDLFIQGVNNVGTLININQSGTDDYCGVVVSRDGVEQWFVGINDVDNDLILRNDETNDLFTFQEDGDLGIGTVSPASKLHVLGAQIIENNNIDAIGNYINFIKSRGVSAAQDNDEVGYIDFRAYDGTTYERVAAVIGRVEGEITATGSPGKLSFFTTPIGSNQGEERMMIRSTGDVAIGTAVTSVFTNVAGTSSLVVTGESSSSNVLNNTDANITISNTDDTEGNTSAVHFAWEDTDGSDHYVHSSIVAQSGAKTTGQYPAGGFHFLTSNAGNFAPTVKMQITATGLVGIGRTPVTNILEIDGNASKTAGGDWLTNSDRRLKEDIKEIEGALDILDQLRVVSFRYNDKYVKKHKLPNPNTTYYGFIAQEFQQTFPEHVSPRKDGMLQMDGEPAKIVAIAAIKELKEQFDTYKQQAESRIKVLEDQVRALKK